MRWTCLALVSSMARVASPGDYPVTVDGLGQFVFGRRTMRDEFAIAAEYSRLTEGVADARSRLAVLARAFAAIKVLMVSSPNGWDVAELNPGKDASYAQLEAVFDALLAAEADFLEKS